MNSYQMCPNCGIIFPTDNMLFCRLCGRQHLKLIQLQETIQQPTKFPLQTDPPSADQSDSVK